jgi:hypothetical protein
MFLLVKLDGDGWPDKGKPKLHLGVLVVGGSRGSLGIILQPDHLRLAFRWRYAV